MEDLKAVNIFRMGVKDHAPVIHLEGEPLLYSNFIPNKFLKAEMYDNKIVITPVVEEKSIKVVVK